MRSADLRSVTGATAHDGGTRAAALRWVALTLLLLVCLGGCAGLPPGADFAKTKSTALATPAMQTELGRRFGQAAHAHNELSGFRLVPSGFEGYLMRVQMLDAAQKTVDMQYYIFKADDSGKLVLEAILRAADRGVRVRLLVDDVDNTGQDAQIEALDAHPNIEMRLFNPLRYRGNLKLLRGLELLFNAPRLDYRMHNKQLVIDNTAALVGGRNIGDEYFQRDPEAQQGDFETFAAGPVVQALSKSFDEFWASVPAIPAEALFSKRSDPQALDQLRVTLREHKQEQRADGSDFVKRAASGEPWRGIVEGRTALSWAKASVEYDSPEKKEVDAGRRYGRLMSQVLADAVAATRSELNMISAYFVPGEEGMHQIAEARERGVKVRVLTNSLAANNEPLAHAGYLHYRKQLLRDGVDLYEVRAKPGSPHGTAQPLWISSYGNYSLHTKLFVFDRDRIFVSSMNYDQRSLHLNTELGLMIESPELADQGLRFIDALAQPLNAYHVTEQKRPGTDAARIVWHTEEDGQPADYDTEPAKSEWQRLKIHLLALLPLDSEL
ncbi:MAG: phospholipase D/Transphosphatidylase [Betaproteobacteria bacterium]|nr:phospholipase D/Transphosphatidylase [Betaproteobacteria bacterium]